MWYNKPMTWLLRSPFHTVVSGGILLLTYKGRKSGQEYSTPVNYSWDGSEYRVVSLRERVWWRNFRGGARANLLVRGKSLEAQGEVIEDSDEVGAYLMEAFRMAPQRARYFGVALEANGNPDPENLAREASKRVLVNFRPLS